MPTCLSRRILRGGFTLIELLVVIGIIGVLASMILMTVVLVRERARRTETSNHLREIVAATITYSTDQRLPPWPHGIAAQPSTPRTAMAATGGIFEILARVNELSGKLFDNPLNPQKVTRPPRQHPDIVAGVDAADETTMMWAGSFAYDWAVPQNCGSVRVVIADRGPSLWGYKGVLAAYADGHAEFIFNVDELATGETWNEAFTAPTSGRMISIHASVQDDIYLWGENGENAVIGGIGSPPAHRPWPG